MNPERCKKTVADGFRVSRCWRRRKPGTLYCKQHHPKQVEKRRKASSDLYSKRMKELMRPGRERMEAIELLRRIKPFIDTTYAPQARLMREVDEFLGRTDEKGKANGTVEDR